MVCHRHQWISRLDEYLPYPQHQPLRDKITFCFACICMRSVHITRKLQISFWFLSFFSRRHCRRHIHILSSTSMPAPPSPLLTALFIDEQKNKFVRRTATGNGLTMNKRLISKTKWATKDKQHTMPHNWQWMTARRDKLKMTWIAYSNKWQSRNMFVVTTFGAVRVLHRTDEANMFTLIMEICINVRSATLEKGVSQNDGINDALTASN